MSPPNSDQNKPAPDIYVGLLFASVTALLIGIIFLWAELDKYGFAPP
jgi:hypothetical protein